MADLLPTRRPRPSAALLLACILLLGVGIRLAFWMDVRATPLIAHPIMDSAEYDRWARAIAAGDWLGSGVFFQAPLYPYLLGGLYAVFGRHLDLVYLLQVLLSGLTIYALYRAGRRMLGERAGLAAAGLAALYGPFVFYDVQLQKEPLAIFITATLLWTLAELRGGRSRAGAWLAPGLLLGVLGLLRENALVLIPFLLPLMTRKGERIAAAARRAVAFAGGVALALLPVTLRNGLVGGSFLPTTFQAGTNFYIGNHQGASGTYESISPGKQIPSYEREEPIRIAELEAGRSLSAAAVSSFWMRRSLAWAASHPGDFLALQGRKLGMFWSDYEWPDAIDYYYVRETSGVLGFPLLEFGGVTLLAAAGAWIARKRWRELAPAWLFGLGWMISVVVFFVFARYRIPIVPPLLVLGGAAVAALADGPSKRRAASVILPAAALALAFAAPILRPHAPRWDLVHYNLGRVAEERGDPAAAEIEYRKTLESNPGEFLALVNLGNIAAGRGEWDAALDLFRRASAAEPMAEGPLTNIARIEALRGRTAEADAALDRALAINPRSPEALHNKAALAAMRGDFAAAREFNRRTLEAAPGWAPAVELGRKLDRAAPLR